MFTPTDAELDAEFLVVYSIPLQILYLEDTGYDSYS